MATQLVICWIVLNSVAFAAATDVATSPRISDLQSHPTSAAAFWRTAASEGTPLVDRIQGTPDCLVSFLWRGSATTIGAAVVVADQVQLTNHAYSRQMAMNRVAETDVWFRTYRMRCDARFVYKLADNPPVDDTASLSAADGNHWAASFVADPLNRTGQFDSVMGMSSIAELPDAPPQPLVHAGKNIARGHLKSISVHSAALGGTVRTVWIYTPPGYRESRHDSRLLVTFDGENRRINSQAGMPVPDILDNLIAGHRIPPVVAVLVENGDGTRGKDLACSTDFNRFLANDLMPRLRQDYSFSAKARDHIVAGASLGGLAATCAAFSHPELFGKVLAQSGAFAMSEAQLNRRPEIPTLPQGGELFTRGFPEAEVMAKRFATSPKLDLQFYLEVGLMEDLRFEAPLPFYGQPSTLLASRHLRDVLRARGYKIAYHEYNGAHDALNWRGTFGGAVEHLLRPEE